MPTFSTVRISEARARSVSGKRAVLLQEYIGYIGARDGGRSGDAGYWGRQDAAGDPLEVRAPRNGSNLHSQGKTSE